MRTTISRLAIVPKYANPGRLVTAANKAAEKAREKIVAKGPIRLVLFDVFGKRNRTQSYWGGPILTWS
jgi:hypothetical protein